MVDGRYISRSIQFNDVMSLNVAAQQLRTNKVLKKKTTLKYIKHAMTAMRN